MAMALITDLSTEAAEPSATRGAWTAGGPTTRLRASCNRRPMPRTGPRAWSIKSDQQRADELMGIVAHVFPEPSSLHLSPTCQES